MSNPLSRPDLLCNTAIVPIAWKQRIFDGSSIYRDIRPHGETVEEMVRSVPGLPDRFWTHGTVRINGHPVDPEMWRLVRPHATSPDKPIVVTLHMPPGGGGGGDREGGGGKGGGAIIGIVAMLAITIATAGIAAGALGPAGLALAGGFFAAGSTSASILAAGVGLVGSLAISALTAPPAVENPNQARSSAAESAEAASAEGNVIAPGGAIPRVIGTRKVYPALACEPVTELVGDDEYVEAVYILNGPHDLSEIRVGDTALEEAEDVEFQLREGWEDDAVMDLIIRQGKTSTPQMELSTHAVDSEDPYRLKHGTPADLPVWHTVATRNSPNEVWIHLLLPQGLNKNGETTNDRSIPLRLQMRRRGDVAWINLPEMHISDRTSTQRRRAILLRWTSAPESIPSVPSRSGFVYANILVPGQAVDPPTSGWAAHSYFDNGVGIVSELYRSVEGSTAVANLALYDNRAEVYLDDATFPPGIYDIRIKRGYQYDTSTFTKSSYAYAGDVQDFFHYKDTAHPQIAVARENLADQIYLTRVVSIWHEHPVPLPGFAIVAVKARNRRVESLSCLASGYVKDWDGTGWNNWTTTSNPAPHYADILSGRLNLDPLPDDLRDDDTLVEWRTLCTAEGYTCDTIADDMRTQDILNLLASCGYARPYQSEVYGVTMDRDVSAEAPVQIFTPRNSVGFRWERSFPRLPDGFVVTFRDSADDYNDAQEIVYRTGYEGGESGLLETTTYDGLVTRAKVAARAKFDLDQAEARGAFYYLTADLESLVSNRGSLVGVQHDAIIHRTSSAYIRRKILSGSNITGLELDSEIPIVNEPAMELVPDMTLVPDMEKVGIQTGITIRRSDGSLSTHTLSTATSETDTVTFVTPVADAASIESLESSYERSGSLIVSGYVGTLYRRCLVSGIVPGPDLTFALTLVDEAPELVRG